MVTARCGGVPDLAVRVYSPRLALGFRFLPVVAWRGRSRRSGIRSSRPTPRAGGVFPGAGWWVVEGRPAGPVLTDRFGLRSGAGRRSKLRSTPVLRSASLQRMRGRAALEVVCWWCRFFFLDLRRGDSARIWRGMGFSPGRRFAFFILKISSSGASYYCGGSKSYLARCLHRFSGDWCRSPSSPSTSSAAVGGDLHLGSAQNSGWTGLLFLVFARGLCAFVVGQLSTRILLSLYLYLYSFSLCIPYYCINTSLSFQKKKTIG